MAYVYDSMDSFIMAVAREYNLAYGDAVKDLDKITRKTSKEMAEEIKQKSPRRPYNKTGKHYSDYWTAKGTRNDNGILEFTVYNSERYMLTHLLEYSHFAGKDMHVVSSQPHIGPSVEKYNKLFIERIEKKWSETK